jgi:pyruvate formate lyase activating enzyme
MKEGIIFDIREFSLHDGPGIRTTVFLKGCPLRCAWCHNPEGLSAHEEVMVSVNRCTHCGKCDTPACTANTPQGCCMCGYCLDKCPLALRRKIGERITSQSLAERIMKNAAFLKDGGVTFSGGEPLMQHKFLEETLSYLSIHTAIQTSGYCDTEVFRRIIQKFDFVFFDVKHSDPQKYMEYCGVNPQCIFDNLAQLKALSVPFAVRIPLIKNVNDDEENLKSTAKLLAGANALQYVELLPYNEAAPAKYEMVNRKFERQFCIGTSDTRFFNEYSIHVK